MNRIRSKALGTFSRGALIAVAVFLLSIGGFISMANTASAQGVPPAQAPEVWCYDVKAFGVAGQTYPECYDGFGGTVSAQATCQTAATLANLGFGPQCYKATDPNAETGAIANLKKLGGAMLGTAIDATVGLLLKGLAFLFYQLAGFFMSSMGYLLDFSIKKTLDSDIYNGLAVINSGWTFVRDIANMFFIFVLLYIAITTILGMAGHNTKTMLRNVIIAALLINFSLFLTKVVIDAGNIVAWQFWSTFTKPGVTEPMGPSEALREGLDLQTVWKDSDAGTVEGGKNTAASSPTFMQDAAVYAGGAILMFIAGYVFMAGAIMMLIRSVTLIILMIFSPIAFVGFVLPKTSGYANQWWNKLISNVVVAPIYLAMLYLVVAIVRGGGLRLLVGPEMNKAAFGPIFQGEYSNIAILYNYFILCALMLASLKVAQAVAGETASAATKWAKVGIGGGVAGTAWAGGAIYRRTAGKYYTNKLESDEGKALQERAKQDNADGKRARIQLARMEKLAKGTGDVRNIAGVGKAVKWSLGQAGINTGTGSTANALDTRDKKEKAILDDAKRLFPGNPEAQQAYINEKMGSEEFGKGRHKEARKKLERDVREEQSKAFVDNHAKAMEGMTEAERDAYLKQRDTTTGRIIGEEVAEAIERMGAKTFADLKESTLQNGHIVEMAGGHQLAAMNAKADEYEDRDLVKNTTTRVLDHGTDSGKRYAKSQMRSGASAMKYDYEKDLEQTQQKYDAAIAAGDAAEAARQQQYMGTIVARIDPNDVADLDESISGHTAMAGSYKRAHLAAFHAKQVKDGAYSKRFIENMHANVEAAHATASSAGPVKPDQQASLDYMNAQAFDKKSKFYNEARVQARYDDITRPGGLLEDATNRYTDPALSPADQAAAKKEYDKLDKEAARLKKTLED